MGTIITKDITHSQVCLYILYVFKPEAVAEQIAWYTSNNGTKAIPLTHVAAIWDEEPLEFMQVIKSYINTESKNLK